MTPRGTGRGRRPPTEGKAEARVSKQDADRVARADAEANSAVQAIRQGDRRAAEQHATRAITLVEEIEAERIKREEYASFAMALIQLGFHDRGLDLARRAIQESPHVPWRFDPEGAMHDLR